MFRCRRNNATASTIGIADSQDVKQGTQSSVQSSTQQPVRETEKMNEAKVETSPPSETLMTPPYQPREPAPAKVETEPAPPVPSQPSKPVPAEVETAPALPAPSQPSQSASVEVETVSTPSAPNQTPLPSAELPQVSQLSPQPIGEQQKSLGSQKGLVAVDDIEASFENPPPVAVDSTVLNDVTAGGESTKPHRRRRTIQKHSQGQQSTDSGAPETPGFEAALAKADDPPLVRQPQRRRRTHQPKHMSNNAAVASPHPEMEIAD